VEFNGVCHVSGGNASVQAEAAGEHLPESAKGNFDGGLLRASTMVNIGESFYELQRRKTRDFRARDKRSATPRICKQKKRSEGEQLERPTLDGGVGQAP
jgi:hypothetical protein